MYSIEIFQIDAFTDKVFHGNPAAVCLLKHWLNDELLQAIAVENNLSETAFILEAKDGYQIRWFTPNGEINLCGHATLAAGFLLFELGKGMNETIHFSSLSGPLYIKKKSSRLVMDFPRLNYETVQSAGPWTSLIDKPIAGAFISDLDYLILLANESDVLNAQVDLKSLAKMPKRGLILTAKSNDADFYSRCFYPKHHIPEDPVTGSAHCVLAPFWAERLNKTSLKGIQGSFRKGEVLCDVFAERIHIAGYCKWYFKGHLVI
ncbi:PhzF family phenazine biosynthesis protein [Legionella oakridgensis]|uniref:Phenazine biosynthesis protein PhzF family n=2 Tax=Legionella oakridgensis TaxID=29423 RepID=W0BEU9_9GAMM|nr:PhzF family phenazine biosynthesis protein [Legionella oakridgensis]AHE67216.1 phenazine biosynthesis protein PhzF family [Legionella oakridgensis ATCC 33761 = DSM 21215]ETO93180.1 phenazine biosynthesis protein PhzF family [Legionella oakridgensis RV-2-2007]KTD37985.1 phenazine biosynthesis PhzF [Legionella oakridgensis]STY20293.1 phenazine biosynthesis PhzF [Legionella longbeachae]